MLRMVYNQNLLSVALQGTWKLQINRSVLIRSWPCLLGGDLVYPRRGESRYFKRLVFALLKSYRHHLLRIKSNHLGAGLGMVWGWNWMVLGWFWDGFVVYLDPPL